MGACWWLSEDMEYDCASKGVATDQHTHRVCHREGVYFGLLSFPCGSAGKESTCNAGDIRDVGWIPWVEKSPWRRERLHTPVFLPGESHGQRSLVGYSPQGHKESDTTKVT